MNNFVLGIGGLRHNSSVALLKDGKIVAAIQEERLSREKNIGGFPFKGVEYCLKHAGIERKDVSAVAFYTRKSHMVRMLYDDLKVFFLQYRNISKIPSLMQNIYYRGIKIFEFNRAINLASKQFSKENIHFIDHHDAHAAGSYFLSPFSESLILVVDAVGDGHCCSIYYGEKEKLTRLVTVEYPHSISNLYTLMTQYLGFSGRGNQYKLMGLSSYGEPMYYDKLKSLILFTDNGYKLNPIFFDMKLSLVFSKHFYNIFGPPRNENEEINKHHKNLAASIQKLFEEVVFHLCNIAKKIKFSDNLCLAGGSALNCVSNGKLISKKMFKNVFVPPGAGDCGTSIGSALFYYNSVCQKKRNFILTHDYWGNEFNNEEVLSQLEKHGIKYCSIKHPAKVASKALAEDKIVGWFQGRSEFGPRALGNRSILADPRSLINKDRINKTIKFREEFRPFAPAILAEKVDDFFEKPYCRSPFMTFTFPIKPDKRSVIPSVVHIDGSGRLQSVEKENNKLFYELIKNFYELTGIPIVLNTSFNIAGDAIVSSVEDAVNTFNACDIDVLIIGNFLVAKNDNDLCLLNKNDI